MFWCSRCRIRLHFRTTETLALVVLLYGFSTTGDSARRGSYSYDRTFLLLDASKHRLGR